MTRMKRLSAPIWAATIGAVIACGAMASVPASAATRDVGTPITTVQISSPEGGCQNTAPVTFGQPFRDGDVPRGGAIRAELDGHDLPTQLDVKARNPDGSARHAVITVDAPCPSGGRSETVALIPGQAAAGAAVTIEDLMATQFDASFTARIDGQTWQLDARKLLSQLERAGGCDHASLFYCRRWLAGPLATEWIVGAPLQDVNGKPQDRLAAYFAVRAYGPAPVRRVRVDVVVENDWTYGATPSNVVYDAQVNVPGAKSVQYPQLKQYLRTRWHTVRWWGDSNSPPLYAALDPAYLQSTPAVPSYEKVEISHKLIKKARQLCAPMKNCDISAHMQNTGAQPQIGPLPQWSSAYVIDTQYRLFRWMLANSDALGAYATHFRDRSTGEAVSITAHPCITTLGRAAVANCPVAPHGDDRLDWCKGDCKTPLNAEVAHQPAPAYVAYLSTGDWYYEQELQFWADWNLVSWNPGYRKYTQGIVSGTQLRGSAWILRTLGDAAYLLPDSAPLKTYFNQVVSNNLAWYNEEYSNNPKANKLGAIADWHAMTYTSGGEKRVGLATWQQSFFTWTVGNLKDQGFTGADTLLNYVSQFQVGMMTTPGFCWPMASSYAIRLRQTRNSPLYENFKQVYDHSFPKLAPAGCDPQRLNAAISKKEGKRFNAPVNSMVGYPGSDTGFPANFQIGLAAATDSDLPAAAKAWTIFSQRASQPSYQYSPQFAVVPDGSKDRRAYR